MFNRLIAKPDHGSLEWLKLRHRDNAGNIRVAASEAAAVHDQHRFISKYALATEKLADTPTVKETSRAMDRGNRLEWALLNWLGDEIGVKLVAPDFMYALDWETCPLIATIDGIDYDSYLDGCEQPNVVAEIKTYNREWDGVLPAYWYWQGVQQAICCDVDEIVWGVFDSTLDLHVHRQKVTGDEKAEHMEAVKDFLWYVNLGTIPAEWPATYNEISERFPTADGDTTDLTEHADLVHRIIEVQAAKKLLETEEDTLKATIAQLMKDAHTGIINGQPAVTWKSQNRKGFDKKAFTSDHPDLYSQYENTTTIRVMRFKGER
jgi:hypothetical protein